MELRQVLHVVLAGGAQLFGWISVGKAQEVSAVPIRVESNQVVVPVVVLDQVRLGQLQRMDSVEFANEAKDKQLDFLKGIAVSGMTARDFQVFEDGHEENIRSANFEAEFQTRVKDSLGEHIEAVGVGGGIWLIPGFQVPELNLTKTLSAGHRDLESGNRAIVKMAAWPGYLIAYTPPASAAGSCHQITVKANRPNTVVYARSEYCGPNQSTVDPLNGTELGQQMQSAAASKRPTEVPLSLAAASLFTTSAESRVEISLEWPSKPRELVGKDCRDPPKVAVLGSIVGKEGNLVARFSDWWSPALSEEPLPLLTPGHVASCVLPAPNRYETQLYLGPGEFNLRVVLRNGEELGRAETPLIVQQHDGQHLALSGIALAKSFREGQVGPLDASVKTVGNYVALISNTVQYMPAADTRFRKGEPFYFYFELSEPEAAALPNCSQATPRTGLANGCGSEIQIHVRIVEAKTGELVSAPKPIAAAPYRLKADAVVPIGGGLNISSLSQGSYRLEVKATDLGGQSTSWRAANFTVE